MAGENPWTTRAAVKAKNARMARMVAAPFQDTMQVCLAGHKITGRFNEQPQSRKDHCGSCGKATVTKCPNCQFNIPGYIRYPTVISSDDSVVPDFCSNCGAPFPWSIKEEEEFLAIDFGGADVSTLPIDDATKNVIQSRLDDAGKCLQAGIAMPVIFSCGSAIEGMLLAYALKHPKVYIPSSAAPMKSNTVKPIPDWTLEELINVAKDVGHIDEFSKKFALYLKEYRNYIHPREQVKAGFHPHIEVARTCYQVAKSIISNLERVENKG